MSAYAEFAELVFPEDKRNPGINTTKGEEADNSDQTNMPTQGPSESSHDGAADSDPAPSCANASTALPAPCAPPDEGGSRQLDCPPLILEDPLVTLEDPLLELNNHNDSLSDFHGGSQALLSAVYDTPATYWSSCTSSPVSDFSGYSSSFEDMDFTTMLNAPLHYFPTTVSSGTAATQNSTYPAFYIPPMFGPLEPSPFEAPQAVVPGISHSSYFTSGLPHPLISNEMAPPHLAPSNMSSGVPYPPVLAPNINHLSASNPCPLNSNQTASHFAPSNVLDRTDQSHPVASGPQSSKAPTTSHPSRSIPAVASCPPSANDVTCIQQQECASQSKDPLALPVAQGIHNLNVTDNSVVPEASPSEAENVAEIRRSARRPVPSTRADLANSIGGNTHAIQAPVTALKKRGNADPSNSRQGAKRKHM
ncbi:hypothetical protein JVT61DRAFT_13936 [Boletus reticuloceps]|uniref:Uncharacterized protein n=1 Tax=Boletus reticuloceps TaxID=495285 RepID=A0A8I2YTG0_9AGAM|nr:hypothetical protein JVT61DRAFT_13936 [Boletus reticuloceps]